MDKQIDRVPAELIGKQIRAQLKMCKKAIGTGILTEDEEKFITKRLEYSNERLGRMEEWEADRIGSIDIHVASELPYLPENL